MRGGIECPNGPTFLIYTQISTSELDESRESKHPGPNRNISTEKTKYAANRPSNCFMTPFCHTMYTFDIQMIQQLGYTSFSTSNPQPNTKAVRPLHRIEMRKHQPSKTQQIVFTKLAGGCHLADTTET